MNRQRVLGAISAIGRNALAVAGVTLGGWSASAAIVLYLCEAAFLVILTAVFVWLKGPRGTAPMRQFLLAGGALLLGNAIFIGFLVLGLNWLAGAIVLAEVRNAILGIAAIDVLQFAFALAQTGPLSRAEADRLLAAGPPMQRLWLLTLAVLIGGFASVLGGGNIDWFVYPFVGIKATTEIIWLFGSSRQPAPHAHLSNALNSGASNSMSTPTRGPRP